MTSPIEAEVADAPAAPLPGPRPAPRALGSLLFRQPAEDQQETTESPETGTTAESPDLPGGSPSGSEWPDDGPSDPSDADPTSSTESSADDDGPVGQLLGVRSLRKTFRRGVKVAGAVGHRFGARTTGQVQAGFLLADDEDAEGIGDPLASIAHRRGGIAGTMSPDTNDAVQALLALGGYVAKQIAAAQLAQQIDAGIAAGEVQPMPGGGQ